MPRRKNIYKRNGIWWLRVMVAGREHRSSLRTSDERVAERRAEAEREKLIALVRFGERRVSWMEAFVAWSEHMHSQVAAGTLKRYAVSLRQIEPHVKLKHMDEIDAALISEIIKDRRKMGATTATIRRDLTALSSVLGYAEGEGWRPDNPALSRLKKLRERRDPIVLPDDEDINAALGIMPTAFAALARVALLTGCRQNELVTLERRQIDHQRRAIMLYRTKTNRPRVVPLSPPAYAELTSVPPMVGSRVVFHHSGEPFRNVSSRFAGYVKSARNTAQQEGREFRSFRFHDLRHRFAVDYLRSGGSLYDLKDTLGHSSVKTTEGYLRFLTPEEARTAMHGSAQFAAQQATV